MFKVASRAALVTVAAVAATLFAPAGVTAAADIEANSATMDSALAAGIQPAPAAMTRRIELNARLRTAARARATDRMLSGILVDQHNEPLRNRELSVFLEPATTAVAPVDAGVGVPLIDLGQAMTDDSGQFTVDVAHLPDLTGYREEDGTASVLVTTRTGKSDTFFQHLRLSPPRVSGAAWRWAQSEDASDKTRLTGRAAAAVSQGASVAVKLAVEDVDPVGGATPLGVNPYTYCSYNPYWVRSDANIIYKDARIQHIYTLGKTTMLYTWTNQKKTETGAAANIGAGGALASAGYVKVQAGGTSIPYSVGKNSHVYLRAAFEWKAYNLYCTNSSTGNGYYSGKYEWRPYKATGGSNKLSTTAAPFACYSAGGSRPQSISSPVTVSKSATNTWSTGVSWNGALNLSSKQTNSDDHTLTVTPTGTAKVCGDTSNVLADAKRVRETT